MHKESAKNSVDLFTRESGNEVAARVALVNGKIVADGPAWVHELIQKPHGNWVKRNKVLVPADQGREFLVALVEQYDGSGMRARWTP